MLPNRAGEYKSKRFICYKIAKVDAMAGTGGHIEAKRGAATAARSGAQ